MAEHRLRRGLLPALLCLPLLTVLVTEAATQTNTQSVSVSPASAPFAADWDQGREQPLGPSYDCENAQSSLEHTVCSDPLLSQLDLQVATLFRDRLKEAPVRGADSTPQIPASVLLWGYRDELEEGQRRWVQARDDECDLSFDFDSGPGAHYTAIPCLIDFYVRRLVELDSDAFQRSGQRLLNVLVAVGSVALGDMKLDLGNVRIDLPGVLPMTLVGALASMMPHPACIDALLRARIPSNLGRHACHAGTSHLPHDRHSYRQDEDYASYVPWHPNWLAQKGDRFAYRIVGELHGGRTLLHLSEEGTGASGTRVFDSLAVTHGLLQGNTIVVERRIDGDNLSGFCGGGIQEVKISDADTLRLVSTISADRMMTLFDPFPEQLHQVSESDRHHLRSLRESGAFSVAMSIVGATCIGHVAYSYDIETGNQKLIEVSVDVTGDDRTTVADVPALACMFNLLLDRYPDMPATLQPDDLDGLVIDFVGTCKSP